MKLHFAWLNGYCITSYHELVWQPYGLFSYAIKISVFRELEWWFNIQCVRLSDTKSQTRIPICILQSAHPRSIISPDTCIQLPSE